MLLATWFKRTLKTSLLGQIYANKAKTKGLGYMSSRNQTHMSSPNAFIGDPQYIYQQYIKAYKKGVFNFIKEDMDKYTNETVPRKYFSGGAGSFDMAQATFGRNVIGITDNEAVGNPAMFHDEEKMDMATVALERNGAMNAPDAAMTSERGQRADRAMMTQERLTTVDALGIISKVFTEKELTNTWDLQGNLNVGKLLLFKPHKEFLASVWLPHFQQIMQERGLSSQEFMREINEEKFDAETIKFLKAPLSNGGNVRSQNEEIVGMDTEAFKKELIERIGVLAKSGDHRLKVDLGGTLYQEINNVTDILERTLEEVARENGVTDPIGAHEWIKGWQVRIRGMSLNTSYLYYMRRSIDNSGDFFQRKWVQLEYIDLLDQRQWPRLTQDPADLLIVSRSLYLGKWNFLMQGSLEKDLNMAFLNNVDKFVKSKGIFVTEIPRTDQVERGL